MRGMKTDIQNETVRDEFEDRTQAIRNGDPVTRIVVVADEYAGLMVSHSERAEPLLAKMLVLGRTAGVHFIFASQRPDEVVMSPTLRCGFPGRIAFKVAFEEDSCIVPRELYHHLDFGTGFYTTTDFE